VKEYLDTLRAPPDESVIGYWSHSHSTAINVTKSSPLARYSHPVLSMFLLFHWAIAVIYFPHAYGKLYTSPDQLTKTVYDYIVIGGENHNLMYETCFIAAEWSYLIAGTAGSAVSARLSEDPTVSVLVVEAGVS